MRCAFAGYSDNSWAPSRASRRVFVRMPPGPEKPVMRPSAATTRWQGMRSGQRLAPRAVPTARLAAADWPSAAAMAP